MKRYFPVTVLLILALSATLFTSAQNSLKFRFGGNSAKWMGEPQGKEINYYYVDSINNTIGPVAEFINRGNLGFEAEIMMSMSEKVWLGFEFSNFKMSGENDNPGMYNFQFTDFLQLQSVDTATGVITKHLTYSPLKYQTSLLNLMGNLRFYPLPEGNFRPFVRLSAGVSFIATELALKIPTEWMKDTTLSYSAPVLYSRGKPDSPKGRSAALILGGGLGFELQLTEKIALYADGTYMMLNSDIADGKPNFDYDEEKGKFFHFNTFSNIGKLSFGIVYTLGDNYSILGGGGKGSSKSGKGGRTSPFLPFYRIKGR